MCVCMCMCTCVRVYVKDILRGVTVYYRELGGSCKLILDVIKCEPPAVKVSIYYICKRYNYSGAKHKHVALIRL